MKWDKKAKALQRRRLRAGRLLAKGVAQAEVARRVGVSRATVCEWNARLAQGGLAALHRRRRGRPSKLTEEQRAELPSVLKAGALQQGFSSELWTLPRVGQLIKHRYGVRYTDSHIWRILSDLGWSCQRPTNQARERNAKAIREWKQKRWPALKKTPDDKDVLLSSSTNPD
jgi:transposase